MSDEGASCSRRSILGAGVTAGAAAATGIVSRSAGAIQHRNLDNFALGRTDENDLSADDLTLPRRVCELIHIGNVGIAAEDNAALAAFFHPQFRFHGPGGELTRVQLWEYFAGVFVRAFTGLREGPLAPTGKRFEYRVINIFRYASNGQLAEEWVQYDTSAFLAQLR